MDYHLKAESGIQLLARLTTRQSVGGLEKKLFHSGPKPKETIEINGGPSTGKTLLLTQFILKSILPTEYKNIKIGGLNVGVIFIETDSNFSLYHLVSLMERTILSKMKQSGTSVQKSEIEEIIKTSLSNLILLSCYNSAQLFITFHSLEILLPMYQNVSLILLDSIAAYYSQDVMTGGIKRIDAYCKKIVQLLQLKIMDSNVTLIYTKPSFFQCRNSLHEEISSEPKVGKVNLKISLKVQELASQNFIASIQHFNSTSEVKYTIGNGGFKWL